MTSLVGGLHEGIHLGTVLSFFSGADKIPPIGFDSCTLNFSESNIYPTASTCALCLTLPTKYAENYSAFCHFFLYGLRNHGGFGLH